MSSASNDPPWNEPGDYIADVERKVRELEDELRRGHPVGSREREAQLSRVRQLEAELAEATLVALAGPHQIEALRSPVTKAFEVLEASKTLLQDRTEGKPSPPGVPPRRQQAKRSPVLARVVAVSGLVVLGSALVLLLLPSSHLSLTSSCEPEGILAHGRASVQGRRFWAGQLRHLDAEVAWLMGEPERMAKMEAELAEVISEIRADREEFYKEHPGLPRPLAAEEAAAAHRDEADALEAGELDRELEEFRLQRISSLQRCRAHLESRLGE